MTLLDTDHLTALGLGEGQAYTVIHTRMATVGPTEFAIPIVSAEEQMRGWLAYVKRFRTAHEQILAYDRLIAFFKFLGNFPLVPFDPVPRMSSTACASRRFGSAQKTSRSPLLLS